MDDSELDFVDLCSKLLKRVRKKVDEPSRQKKPELQSSSQSVQEDKKRRNNKQDGDSGRTCTASQPVGAVAELDVTSGRAGCGSGDPESLVSHTDGMPADKDLRAKVLLRMQHFKRVSPQKMVHTNAEHQKQESDEALALRLQQQLDREAVEAQTVDLEDGGLFFCQICHRDLSHMTPEGRTHHLNRCLDESEESGPGLPPHSSVPDCPICGKKFKSKKSRSTHLKRCSSDMGVSPAVLLQVLQRQSEEGPATANALVQPGVNKRKGPSKSSVPARKKPRKKAEPLDEETMVALALSSSMVEQEKQQQQREKEEERCLQMENALPHSSMTPALKWRQNAGKSRGKKKRVPRPPPLLLVQDAETALSRLQERVSAFLLRSRAPSPATPTRCPSTLPAWTETAPLWQKSALLDEDSTCLSDFYTAELKHFFSSWESAKTDAAPSSTNKKPDSSVQPVNEGTLPSGPRTSILLPCSQTASCSSAPSTPGTGQLTVGSQALRDLMDLAEDGMTLTQYGYTAKENNLSGFIREESEDQAELSMSGFVVETTHKPSDETCGHAERAAAQPGAEEEKNAHKSGALSKLASDLSSMVNNPQMSDVQLQVDSGEVYFAHSFMVYARCPLLAEMVHESGFGAQEEGVAAAQRVLLGDLPGQAVFSLLQYLYTSYCSIPAALLPHMLELASRFDLQELEQLCQLQQENSAPAGDEALDTNQEENANNHTDQAFMELLRSMWNEDDEDVMDSDGGGGGGGQMEKESDEVASIDRETHEEQVNEEELEEIYEFAATQRKKEEKDTEEEEEEHGGDAVFTELIDKGGIRDKSLHPDLQPDPDLSVDRSYSRLFSASWGIYEEEDGSSSASKLKTCPLQHQSPPKASSVKTLLQSSASLLDDFLISSPPVTSNLPVTGLSPGQMGDQEDEAEDEGAAVPLKHESQPPCSICIPLSPDVGQKKEEPELILLSDSSEEMDVAVFSPCRSSDPSPSIQNYTGIKPKQDSTPSVAPLENNKVSSIELSPNDPPDCSPELSWLIPCTPDQSSRSTKTSSTQTRSSICRMQLFPKGGSSSSLGFSPPESSYKSKRHIFSDPQKASDAAGTTESCVSRLKLSSSLDLKCSSEKSPNACKESEVFAANSSQSKLLHIERLTHQSLQASSKQDSPLHLQIKPNSSTPLPTELHQLHIPPAASPLHSDTVKQNSSSPKRERIRSFHPTDPPSSSSFSECQRSRRESSSSDNTQEDLKRTGARNEDEEKSQMDCSDEGAKEETGEADVGESSFQQSFMAMDEPPIAFNDSWGLDACAEVNPGCFSLGLEDSGRSDPQERSSSFSKPPSDDRIQTASNHRDQTIASQPRCHNSQPSRTQTSSSSPGTNTRATAEIDKGFLDSKLWDSWEEGEEEESLPLSQRVSAQLKTPAPPQDKKRRSVVPVTPTPHYSDMDTPELKNKLGRFGVRPLPKRQMILKLKQIHQYTHQLASSDSEEEAPHVKSHPRRPVSCAQMEKFKEPRAPAATSPVKDKREDGEVLSASQGSNSSSTAASEESERSNPELVLSSDSDSDSDGGVSSSQVASRLQDRLQAVRSFILSNAKLYNQILQYQPLVLSQFQAQLKEAGIRLGAAKLVDYLDSQCITFTTAKPGQSGASRGRQGKAKAKGAQGASRKKNGVLKL